MELSSQWAKALEPNIAEWTHNGFKRHADSVSEIFDVSDNSSGLIRFFDSWGPRLISKSTEGGSTHTSTRQEGYETVVAPQIFKEKMAATEEYVSRGMYDVIKNDAQDLGAATIETINLYGNSVFIQAWTSTSLFYGDAKPLASVGHTRPDGGTAQSNASATSIALTEPNVETAMIALKQQKGGNGQKLAISNSKLTLMVQEAQEKEAIIIAQSTRRSGIMDNDLNWYLGKINVYVNPWIGSDITDLDGVSGSDTSWALIDMDNHGLVFVYEKRPSYKMWEDDDHDTMYNKVKYSAVAGWKHWYGTWWSKGDASAYAS